MEHGGLCGLKQTHFTEQGEPLYITGAVVFHIPPPDNYYVLYKKSGNKRSIFLLFLVAEILSEITLNQ